MKEIELTQGKVTLVDDGVYEWASEFNWYALNKRGKFYAVRKRSRDPKTGKSGLIYLHREIMKPGPGEWVDHKFGDTLDNRRSELRFSTRSQNVQGFKRPKENTSSKFRGVCWHKRDGKWQANLTLKGPRIHLGYFDNEADAAHAYDKAARELFGEFAQANFPA